MTNTASETGREGLVGEATSGMGDAAASAQQKASELKQQGRSKLGETLDQRTTQAGGQARQMAQALRRTGEQMREQGEGQQVAGMTDGAAERIERLGGYLEQTSGDDLLRDVEDFARRRPWMVAGIGLMVGMAASRFLKASSERRYDSGQEYPYRSRYGYGTASAGDDYGSVGRETGTGYGTTSPDVSDYETAGRQSEAGWGGESRGDS
jgi:ElaB/YqjD/DUF883 family membrane-anchored ribosome-binding protein